MIAALQGAIGWLSLALVLLTALAVGGNVEAAWLALSFGVAVLFCGQLVCDLFGKANVTSVRTAALAALLFVGALVWALLQTLPVLPQSFAATAWQSVDAAAGAVQDTVTATAPGIVAIDLSGAALILARLAAYGMIFWIAARAATNEVRAKRYLVAIGVWCAGIAIYALMAAVLSTNPITGATDRLVTGPFVNPNHFATYCGIGILALVGTLSTTLEGSLSLRWLRTVLEGLVNGLWFFLALAIVLLTALVLSGSRGGVLALIVGAVAFAVALRRGTARQNLAAAAILAGTLIAFASLLGLATVLPEFLAGDQAGTRQAIYASTVEGILARPWLGYGLGGYPDAIRAFISPDLAMAGEINAAHNSYLENAMELGLPASLAFYAALLLIVWTVWRGAQRRRRLSSIPATAFAIAVLVGAHSLIEFSAQMPAVAALFAFALGIGWAQSFSAAERKPSSTRSRSTKSRSTTTRSTRPGAQSPVRVDVAGPRI